MTVTRETEKIEDPPMFRFTIFDADPETTAIVRAAEAASQASGHSLVIRVCDTASALSVALDGECYVHLIMTHGYPPVNDSAPLIGPGGYGDSKECIAIRGISDDEYFKLTAATVVFLVCNQEAENWAKYLRVGTSVFTSPALVSTAAIPHFVSAIIAGSPTSDGIEEARLLASKRCATLHTREWKQLKVDRCWLTKWTRNFDASHVS